jgi:hypothetical protein
LGTPDLVWSEFRAFNPEIVVKFFNSEGFVVPSPVASNGGGEEFEEK